MRSSSTPKFLFKKIHKFFPNRNNFDGISATLVTNRWSFLTGTFTAFVEKSAAASSTGQSKCQLNRLHELWWEMAGGHPLACALHRGPWHGLTPFPPTRRGRVSPDGNPARAWRKKQKIGKNGCGFCIKESSWQIFEDKFAKQTHPQVEFSEKCWKIMSYRHFFIYLPHFASVLGFLLFGFPWVSPTFGDQIALPPTLKTANQHGKHGGKHRPKSEGRVPPRNVEMMI